MSEFSKMIRMSPEAVSAAIEVASELAERDLCATVEPFRGYSWVTASSRDEMFLIEQAIDSGIECGALRSRRQTTRRGKTQ